MYGVLNRSQWRDEIRRSLGQIPPIDTGGAVGGQPLAAQRPTNADCLWAQDQAVAFFSRKIPALAGDSESRAWPVAAQTANGPWSLQLQSIAPLGSVKNIYRVLWFPTGGQMVQLTQSSSERLDYDRTLIEADLAGTPMEWWIRNGYLLVRPAPSVAGEFLFQAGTCVWSLSGGVDAERPEIFNGDDFPVLVAKSAQLICQKYPEDSKIMRFLPIVSAQVQDGLIDMQNAYGMRAAGQKRRPRTTRNRGYGYR